MKTTNAVLITLTISNWDANCQDKQMSASIASANEVSDNSLCRLRKSLLPKTEVIRKLYQVMSNARKFHYTNTHAWMHEGPRILATANYDLYMTKMRQFKVEFDIAVMDFMAEYSKICESAKTALGKIYKESDYPNVASLKAKYGFEIKVQPMPESASLLELGLEEAETEAIRAQLEQDMQKTMTAASNRVWNDMLERVEKLYTKVSDPESIVREDTIVATRELASLVPRINITNDPRLEILAVQLQDTLKNVTGNGLKVNPGKRQKLVEDLRPIYHSIQRFIHNKYEPEMLKAA